MRMIFATAALAVATTAVAEAPRAQEDEKRVCRRVEPATGSRLGTRRVCRSAAEWRAMEEEEQRAFRAARSGPTLNPPAGLN